MQLNLSERSLRVSPGDRWNALNDICNDGDAPDTFSIELEGLEPTWYELSTCSVSLFPGDSFRSRLSVHPPRDSSAAAKTYTFYVVVSTQSLASELSKRSVYLTLQPFYFFGAQLTGVNETRRFSTCLLRIRNDSNVPLAIQLSGQDPKRSSSFQFDQDETIIGSGETREVGITVRPKRRPLFGSPKAHQFLLKSIVRLPQTTPELTLGSLNVHAWIPVSIWWLLLLLLAIGTVTGGIASTLFWPQ